MSEKRLVIITREKPSFADYFIYDSNDTVENNFHRYCAAQPVWRADCEQWRIDNAPRPLPENDTPSSVDTPRLGGYDTYLKGLFLERVEVVGIIAFCTIFYIFWW